MDVIIVGAGVMGLTVTRRLANQGHDVVVIERANARCETLADDYVAMIIEGDATQPDILEQAGVQASDVVVALTGVPRTNIAVCLEGKAMNPATKTVLRIDHDAPEEYDRFADAVVFPERAGGQVVVNAILDEAVNAIITHRHGIDLLEVRIDPGAPAARKRMKDVRLPMGAMFITSGDDGGLANTETTLIPGKRYMVAVEPPVTDEVLNLLRGE